MVLEISKNSINYKNNLIGGKAFGLQKLIKNNFKVPDFFVISTDVFENLEINKMTSESVLSLEFSQDFKEEILQKFKNLKTQKVSVRSSATNEDGENKSFAGQFDTFLNVEEENLLESIKKCWISLLSTPNCENQKMAVIIQKMIEADFSGVIFTQNPVTKDKNSLICEVVFGYGELLVSGSVTPSHFEIDIQKNIIKNKFLNNHEEQIEISKILDISNKAIKMQKIWAYPLDIEWSLKEDEIFFLQARPITTF